MKKLKRKVVMVLEKTNTGFSAYALEYPVYTTANNIPELLNNAYESVSLFFDDENIKVLPEQIKFEIDFKQFFRYYRVLNAKFLAERIGMHPTLLSQYIQGKKKPSKKQTNKILSGIQKVGKELAEINLI